MKRFIVTQDGKKLPIDDSSLNEADYMPFRRNVYVIDEDNRLKKCWILQLQSEAGQGRRDGFELELKKELKYDKPPTENEIMWAMSEYGIGCGVATVIEGYEFDYSDR